MAGEKRLSSDTLSPLCLPLWQVGALIESREALSMTSSICKGICGTGKDKQAVFKRGDSTVGGGAFPFSLLVFLRFSVCAPLFQFDAPQRLFSSRSCSVLGKS